MNMDGNSVSTIASEPFDDAEEGHWAGVCEDSVLHWLDGQVSLKTFSPK